MINKCIASSIEYSYDYYTVVVTNATGCTGTADVVATVSNPTAGTLTGTQTVAPGETTTISSDGTAQGVWSSSDDAVATVDPSTGVVTGVFGGTADITYTVGGTACPDAASITITVACAADITATYDDISHCAGQSTTLSGSISDGNESLTLTFNGADSFGDGWNGWAVDIAVDGATVVSGFTLATGSAGSTTFDAAPGAAITLTWASGSYASEISWTIDDASGSTVSSGNTQTTDGGTTPSTGTTYTYSWSPTTGLDDPSAANPVTSATTNESYILTITSSAGCTGSGTANLTIDAPTAGTISGTTTAFAGQTSTLSSDGSTGGEWTSDDASVATVDISTGVVTAVSSGTANITYTVGGTSCPDASSIAFTVTGFTVGTCFDMATLPGAAINAANGSVALDWRPHLHHLVVQVQLVMLMVVLDSILLKPLGITLALFMICLSL